MERAKLTMARVMIRTFLKGIKVIPGTDEKVAAISQALKLKGQTWDPEEAPFWAELIEHVGAGGELTDAYLTDWRARYREVLDIE